MPEFRKDPLLQRWVVFAPERKRRPLDFPPVSRDLPPVDAFDQGNEHLTPPEIWAIREEGTAPNQPGWRVRVIPNRFPALRIEGAVDPEAVGFYDRMNGVGAHEVVIETASGADELEDLPVERVAEVLSAYKARILDLKRDSRFRYVLVFKNYGERAGASIRHAHSQIIALPVTPLTLREKLDGCQAYYDIKDRNIFEDILRNEVRSGERVVFENHGFLVYCPFASRLPFEMCVLPKRQSPDFHSCDAHELILLADALRQALRRLRGGLDSPSYNLILHSAPIRLKRRDPWTTMESDFRWHIEILPRLTGIAGFELGTGFFMNTTLPEEAAAFLRGVQV